MTWISVKDKLPENQKKVLVLLEDKEIIVLKYDNRGIINNKNADWNPIYPYDPYFIDQNPLALVTHWIPLPELPKD